MGDGVGGVVEEAEGGRIGVAELLLLLLLLWVLLLLVVVVVVKVKVMLLGRRIRNKGMLVGGTCWKRAKAGTILVGQAPWAAEACRRWQRPE